jgi:hypothetical protein
MFLAVLSVVMFKAFPGLLPTFPVVKSFFYSSSEYGSLV